MGKLKVKRYTSRAQMRSVRVRAKLAGSPLPRLVVFRSNKYIYAQVVGTTGRTVAGIRGVDPVKTGLEMAQKAKKKGLTKVVFDRGRYKYHGKVKAVAESAKEGGLIF